MRQINIFDVIEPDNRQKDLKIFGPAPSEENAKLIKKSRIKVKDIMMDKKWHTLKELEQITGCSNASCSARIRDLRKLGYEVERRLQENSSSIYKYRVL